MDSPASLDPLFQPSSVAVIGASRRTDSIGYSILDNLIRHGYQGVVHPVNPTAVAVHSVAAVPSVEALPGPVDLAAVVVPRDAVLGVVEECGRKGVKALVVITAGFNEVGGEGAVLGEAGVPAYTFPESAARALSALHRYRLWLDRPLDEPTVFEVDRAGAERRFECVRTDGRVHLMEHEALEVLDAYGIPTVERRVATSEAEAVEAAGDLGFPVVVKALAHGLVHKTEIGAVRIDLQTPDAVAEAVRSIRSAVEMAGLTMEGWLVERFLDGGKELIVGVDLDPAFGPVVMVGLGGIYVEALADVAFRVQPVSRSDARDMLASLRGRSLLDGVRGEAAIDRDGLAEAIQRVSQLVGEHHEVAELDINPLLAFPDGVVAVDARIRLADR